MCEVEFLPNINNVRAWGNSGRSFDPTDWVCPDCEDAMNAAADDVQDAYLDMVEMALDA